MDVKQISVFLENRPGALYEFTELLKKNDINMRALCLAEISEYGVLRLIVDDNYELTTVLKAEDYIFKATPVLAIAIRDEPGSLVNILAALKDAEVNVEYTYAFTTKHRDEAYIILKVSDVEGGRRALNRAGIKILNQEDLEQL